MVIGPVDPRSIEVKCRRGNGRTGFEVIITGNAHLSRASGRRGDRARIPLCAELGSAVSEAGFSEETEGIE